MTFRPLGAELFDADRQTDRHDEAKSRFSLFCERAEKMALNSHHIFRNRNDCWSKSCLRTSPLAVLAFLRTNNQLQKKNIYIFIHDDWTTTRYLVGGCVCTNAKHEGIVSALTRVLSWKGRKRRSGLKLCGRISWGNEGEKESLSSVPNCT